MKNQLADRTSKYKGLLWYYKDQNESTCMSKRTSIFFLPCVYIYTG